MGNDKEETKIKAISHIHDSGFLSTYEVFPAQHPIYVFYMILLTRLGEKHDRSLTEAKTEAQEAE